MNFSDQFLAMEAYINELQDRICAGLESVESGATFQEDIWKRPEGGGGRTRIIQNGNVFEKGGVNISSVYGKMPESIASHMKTEPMNFAACGLSLVIHPNSPKVPTIHMNVRYFEMENGQFWFGGGIDLTPYFPYEKDFTHFHSVMKQACNQVIPGSYEAYKKQCDDYFYIKHRNEMRGIGGIFFDYHKNNFNTHFALVKSVGDSFLESYLPIVKTRFEEAYSEDDKQFQLVRRGRYVEFNLIYDRGTLFGLKTNGRVESILMSLPKNVQFLYDWTPKEGSEHEKMLAYFQPKEWC